MFRNYFKAAVRNLRRTPLFSIINIVGLSIGLACCMLIILYTKDELSYDRVHKNNIYRITATITNSGGNVNKTGSTSMMPGPVFKQAIPEIEAFVRVKNTSFTIKHQNDVFDQDALYVDDNFFSVFSFPLIAGNPQTALAGTRTVVLSEEIAEKFFHKKEVVGETIELNTGKKFEPFVVSAIAKRSPQNSSLKIKMLVPIKSDSSIWNNNQWANFFLKTFVVLKPSANIEAVEAKFASVFNAEASDQLKETAQKYDAERTINFGLQPLAEMHLSTEYPPGRGLEDASDPLYSYILTGIALFILLIACVNFINLTIGHSLRRAKEIGVRKVLGGQRKQLIIQFLGESFILSTIAFVVAVVLVLFTLPFFNTLANKALSFSHLFDIKLVAGYITLLLLTGLLAGFYPALVLSGFNPVQTLYGKLRPGRKNYLSKGLVVFQFTLATFLIVATTIIYTQVNHLMHFDLGYNDKNLVTVSVSNGDILKPGGEISKQQLDAFTNELLKNSSIESVTANQGGSREATAHINGGNKITFDFNYIDENYFPLFQIPIIKGRNFSKNLATDKTASVIVNQSFTRAAGWDDVVGKQIDFFYMGRKYTVIGMIKDYHYTSLAEKIGPQLFTTDTLYSFGTMFIKIKQGNISQTLHYIESAFKVFFPYQPYEYSFKDAQNAVQYEKEARWKRIVTFSAILTIIISCIGLFGLATLSIHNHTKDIAIKKVLGASVAAIAENFCGDFLKLIAVAVVIASPFGWWMMSGWLQNYPYRVSLSWWMFALAATIVLLVAMLTISYQAIKAAKANPMKGLRTE
ncbi:ABC transporter permease [Chitinophaga niabensis]|uniref:Putative ABC transport system permease protein n=1 Tax=Chitinophaga niabensis TaxID=536979 RepID=A0A1N6D7G2_9BACT|nr:ABC transporter permease [Chitinophaga niabensis]SIN66740.1 putative ABC transport system permease protein [Chitinophaga niabensis]